MEHHITGLCVFGGLDRGTAKTFPATVCEMPAETLLKQYRKWILPALMIRSDCWALHNILADEKYTQLN